MRVAGIQHDIAWEDAPANHAALAPRIAAAAGEGARLIVLTEMFATGFSMATDRVAEPPGGPSTEFLGAQAARHGVWVAGSISTSLADRARCRNRFVLAGPDGSLHHVDKLHPFTYGGEHHHYEGGDRLVTLRVDGLGVTPLVCYDLRFADVIWERAPETDLYVVVANWPAPRRAHWQVLLAARAIENQAYVLGVNRVGRGGRLDYAGDSRLVDPLGETVAAADQGVEDTVVGEVDPGRVRSVRERFPFLADRRATPA